jgi:exodeoxyribonuclease VII large subunit
MQLSEEKVYTVTAITKVIKYILDESFPSVWIEGEISNYIHHTSGHRYLSLKDENAVIKVTIWRSAGQYLKFEPENGMKVRVFGDITVYEKGGNYQLNARKIVPVGIGELEVAFRQLYEKLNAEGIFDETRKKSLPEFPFVVGLVTSPTGAAIRDMVQVARRRNNAILLILYPAQVQGEGAENSIIAGINYFNDRDDIDLIIVGRGGGSLEDLWVFNNELLVRAISDSRKPIVTGIGHEIDTTLSDLAADLRASTPSAAAELVIWDKRTFLNNLAEIGIRLKNGLIQLTVQKGAALNQIMNRPVYSRPETLIHEREQFLDSLVRQFVMVGKNMLEKRKNELSLILSKLESLSPLAILNRGYAVVKSYPDGKTIKSVGAMKKEELIEAVLGDGSAIAQIKSIKK